MEIHSSLYQELSDTELRRVIDTALHTTVIDYRLLSGGMFNTTYFVETEACGKVVLRMGPVNRHLIMPFEHHLMETENLFYTLCRAHGIPVSEVLFLSLDKTILDRDVMIVRYIPSKNFYDIDAQGQQRADLFRAFGKQVAAMHEIRSPKFGRLPDVARGGGFDTWGACLCSEMEDYLSVAAKTDIFDARDLRDLREVYRIHRPLADTVKTATLVHTDMGPGNILARTDVEPPVFGALIDPDRGMWGDVEFDFCRIRWMLCDDFVAGYGRDVRICDSETQRRQELCWLLRCCFDTYVWEAEYNVHEYMLAGKREIRQMLDKMLQDPIIP